jgi:hypothetical protein
MVQVPISCAVCGWRLGLGSAGATLPCARCGCWVAAKGLRGDIAAAADGLATVAFFALLGMVFALLLLIFGRATA